MEFQGLVTELGRDVVIFHTWLLWLITAICLLVLALLVTIVVRFSEKPGTRCPSRTTHHTLLEVAWTVVPVLILVAIAIPSFRLLREQLDHPEARHRREDRPATHGTGAMNTRPTRAAASSSMSNMIDPKDLKPGQPRLLSVDNEMVVPVNKTVKVQVTAADVLHSFADAVLRHQDRRHPRPSERDLVQGRTRGRLSRPVLGALRQRAPLHADPDPGGERAAIRRLARRGEAEIRFAGRPGSRTSSPTAQ